MTQPKKTHVTRKTVDNRVRTVPVKLEDLQTVLGLVDEHVAVNQLSDDAHDALREVQKRAHLYTIVHR